LEVERNLVLLGERRQFTAVPGQQRLVGGNHWFAGLERPRHRGPRRIGVATDQFDEGVDPRIACQLDRIGHPTQPLHVEAAILAARARTDGDDLDRPTAFVGQRRALMPNQAAHRRADRAETGETHFEGGSHDASARKIYRRVARGTTLCNFSGADSRKRRMLRAACRMRCSFSTSAMRTKPSPRSPKPVPGDTATSAFSTSSLENSTLSRLLNGSGIGDQANIEALGGGTSHPARPKLSTSTSRRRL